MNYVVRFLNALFTPVRLLFTSPEKLITGPKRLLGLSLPARGAVLAALFLGLAIVVYVCKKRDEVRLDNLVGLAVIWIVVPPLLYVVLQAWLEPGISGFDDIDRAWQAGIKELRRNGLELNDLPLYLLLGSSDEFFERNLFDAAKLSLTVSQFPQGEQALHWYATSEAIYVVASNVGRLSCSNTAARKALSQTASQRPEAPAGPAPRNFDPLRATLEIGAPAEAAVDAERTPPPRQARPDIRGTLEIDGDGPVRKGETEHYDPKPKGVTIAERELDQQTRRLDYLGRLIRRARQPLCPVNGVLALLSFPFLQLGKEAGRQTAEAVRLDLETLLTAFQLRCPVTALVTGMEDESGFRELVRRLGPDRALHNKFGSGFQV
ncbi:MAG TPA: type VI secretion protein IcmF/TssM N-terminal domain-containing protein, partial [Pirellulales bacterium]|nr:type VI secretion protein IcmF/TssM N-terminal domain-containing protein [Pirellulales bacterium]